MLLVIFPVDPIKTSQSNPTQTQCLLIKSSCFRVKWACATCAITSKKQFSLVKVSFNHSEPLFYSSCLNHLKAPLFCWLDVRVRWLNLYLCGCWLNSRKSLFRSHDGVTSQLSCSRITWRHVEKCGFKMTQATQVSCLVLYGGFHKWRYPRMVGLGWKGPLKWMRKPPYNSQESKPFYR